ncbi:GTP diphosphokinase, partial [human gut metagenome]
VFTIKCFPITCTCVLGARGKPVEIQIRTHEMHRMAEYGVAAHWKYKEDPNATGPSPAGGRAVDADAGEMAWLRQLVDWQKETQDPAEFLDSLRYENARRREPCGQT